MNHTSKTFYDSSNNSNNDVSLLWYIEFVGGKYWENILEDAD